MDVVLAVVVDQPTDRSFDVTYRNGQNLHSNSVEIPVELGERKVREELVLNNLEVKNSGSYYTITDDVNNAGLEDAKSITVTTSGVNTIGTDEVLCGRIARTGRTCRV